MYTYENYIKVCLVTILKVLKIKRQLNFVNASHLFTHSSYLEKTYTITARKPSIYANLGFSGHLYSEQVEVLYLDVRYSDLHCTGHARVHNMNIGSVRYSDPQSKQ